MHEQQLRRAHHLAFTVIFIPILAAIGPLLFRSERLQKEHIRFRERSGI
jgi:hypothetical protein